MERFPGVAKIDHVQNHGVLPRVFAQNRPNFDSSEFTLNRHKESPKQLKIRSRGLWNRFREFGAISRTCQNRPCSKPWTIAQGFSSKSAKFRLFRIHPKSTQRVAKAVRNPFMRALELFQTVWSDFQDLPKSAMFKTMGYSPGFLLKIGQFRLFRIHPKSTQRVAKAVRNPFMRALEPFQRVWSDFQDLPKSAKFKTMGYSPGFLLKIGQFSTLANSSQIDTKSHQSS